MSPARRNWSQAAPRGLALQRGRSRPAAALRLLGLFLAATAAAALAACGDRENHFGQAYDIDIADVTPRRGEPPPALGVEEISLRQLESEVRNAVAQGLSTRTLTLGRLTRVTGYRWRNGEMTILGQQGSEKDWLPLDLFVESLRFGDHPVLFMSLVPEDATMAYHKVVSMPPDLKDSATLGVMTQGDYYLKKLLLEGLRSLRIPGAYDDQTKRLMDCDTGDLSARRAETSNVFFRPGKAVLEKVDHGSPDHTIWIRKNLMVLRAGDRVRDDYIRQYAKRTTENMEALLQLPLYWRLQRVFDLSLLATALLEATRLRLLPPDLFSFWLNDYPLEAYATPERLPGLTLDPIGRLCVKDYEEVIIKLELKGGVILRTAGDRGSLPLP